MLSTSTSQLVSTQQQQQDVIRTFVLLQQEKKRLLDTVGQLRSRQAADEEPIQEIQQQQQLRLQMNDFNRRQHAVVQRMSAFDRYRRKKTTMRLHKAPPPSPTIEQKTANGSRPNDASAVQMQATTHTRDDTARQQTPSDQHQLSMLNVEVALNQSAETSDQLAQLVERTKQADTIPADEHQQQSSHQQPDAIAQLQAEINDGCKRFVNNLKKDAKTYKELANMLRGQASETTQDDDDDEQQQQQQQHCSSNRELNKRDVERNEFKKYIMGFVESAEQTKIRLAKIEEQRALDKKRDEEFAERSREVSSYLRQFDKRMEDHMWQKEWRNRRPLVMQRRTNQSANAG